MINTSLYRSFEIIINTQEGGWFVQRYQEQGDGPKLAFTLCSQPTQEAARAWIDKHLEESK